MDGGDLERLRKIVCSCESYFEALGVEAPVTSVL